MYDLLDTVRACEERQGKYADIWKRVGDRIEAQEKRNNELEAALREIEMLHYDSETDFHYDAMKAHVIARAALGEKKDEENRTHT